MRKKWNIKTLKMVELNDRGFLMVIRGKNYSD